MLVHGLSPGVPNEFARVGNINGATPQGVYLNNAPTLTATSANATTTEPAEPGSTSSAVAPASAITAFDGDTAGQVDQLAGAQVRIVAGLQTGAGHQDVLGINGALPAGITASYRAATGVLTLSGASNFAAYQTALGQVRFSVTGDNPTAFGTDSSRTVAYSVTDGLSYSDEVNATVTVAATNDAPVISVFGAQTIAEDTNIALSARGIAFSDVDSDPATQTVSIIFTAAHGTLQSVTSVPGYTVTIGGNGTATYMLTGTANNINGFLAATGALLYGPTGDYNGTDTIRVAANDGGATGPGGSQSGASLIAVTINAVADIANDSANGTEDQALTIAVQGNDTFENAGHQITSVTQRAHGTVAITGSGATAQLLYTPVADYNGTDNFTYTVTSGGVTETATVSANLAAVADLAADTATTNEDTSVDILVQANDSFENASHTISVTGVTGGMAVVNDNGTASDPTDDFIRFTPTADFNGTSVVTYQVSSGGTTETSSATVTVSPIADIADDSYTVGGGTTSIAVQANDSFENAVHIITVVGTPAHGTAVRVGTGAAATMFGGAGVDTLTRGAKDDLFFFGPDRFGPTDVIKGGAGSDAIGLDGHIGALTLDAAHTDVELVALLRGPANAAPDRYGTITVDDSWVAEGQTKTITAVTSFGP